MKWSQPGRVAFLLAGMLLLGACASPRPVNFQPPPLHHTGPDIQIADIDVLAVTPAMDEFLHRYILPYPNSHTKIELLYQTALPSGVLDFNYDESLTLTAAEAFEMHSGNCVGFANMMVALARRAGLKAYYQEIYKEPEWSMNQDTLFLVKHVNVVVQTAGMNYILDVSGLRFGKSAHRQIVDDNYAKAFYLNNLG
ncbi:transglutaminase family protein, partial [Pseudomonadota bacterium]